MDAGQFIDGPKRPLGRLGFARLSCALLFRSCLFLRFWGATPTDRGPVNAGAKQFAYDASQLLDLWAVFGRHLTARTLPLTELRFRDANCACQCCFRPEDATGLRERVNRLCVHAASIFIVDLVSQTIVYPVGSRFIYTSEMNDLRGRA